MPTLDASGIAGLREGESLARYTAARLGGPADYLFVAKDPDYGDALALLQLAWRRGIQTTVLGGGANVLVSDGGIRGLTLINRAARIERRSAGELVEITASSGVSLIRLSRYCQEAGLRGLEWAIAVPGTVGGAVVNNAGAHDGDIACSLRGALILEAEAGERWHARGDLDYAYRQSRLKRRADKRFFIKRARFRLRRDDPAAIQARMDAFNDYRRRAQPPGASLGSIFKNPPGDYAGRLIEAAGLKGLTVGSARVSPIHANFFVNRGDDASAADYYALIRLVRQRVEAAFDLRLELEIQTFGEWD